MDVKDVLNGLLGFLMNMREGETNEETLAVSEKLIKKNKKVYEELTKK